MGSPAVVWELLIGNDSPRRLVRTSHDVQNHAGLILRGGPSAGSVEILHTPFAIGGLVSARRPEMLVNLNRVRSARLEDPVDKQAPYHS
jgi:hypothetical protein